MKVLAAYLLALAGGEESPSKASITKILGSVGVEADGEDIDRLLAAVEGKVRPQPRFGFSSPNFPPNKNTHTLSLITKPTPPFLNKITQNAGSCKHHRGGQEEAC